MSARQGVVFWFRRDLRLHDNPALCQAIALAKAQDTWLLPVVLRDECALRSPWGPLARSTRQQAWFDQARAALQQDLRAQGSDLWVLNDLTALRQLLHDSGAQTLVAEAMAAPDELAEQRQLAHQAPWACEWLWQSTLLSPQTLPFAPEAVPQVFTAFRQAIEAAGLRAEPPVAAPLDWPQRRPPMDAAPEVVTRPAPPHDPRSSIEAHRRSGETAALAHWQAFLDRGLPHRYLDTRNQLAGPDFSSQLSLDLATGALSARRAVAELDGFERTHGASKSSYWLWFELMWREHFRWLHWRHGVALYRRRGLATQVRADRATAEDWQRWCSGQTGEPLVDAGMRELAATGYLSNRMRQIVASYWIHDMAGDWRAGAAWFQAQLLDEDVYTNQGNWLYIAGLGSDPRGGRRFDVAKQTAQHDATAQYRLRWGCA